MSVIDSHQQLYCRTGAAEPFGAGREERHYPPDLPLEPLHLDIDLFIDLAAETATGVVTITVRANAAGARTLQLDALDFLDLSVSEPDGHSVRHSYDGRRLSVCWDAPFSDAEQRRIAVRYRVERPVSGLFFSRPSAAYPHDPWYAATDHETERARHWLPCIDLPGVRTTLDFHLRAERRFTILANGSLCSEDLHEDGTKTAHWRLQQRCPSYLVCFAIGEFSHAEDGEAAGVPVAYFSDPRFTSEDLLRTFGRTRVMLEWMTAKLDMAFPFPKYYQFALPGFEGAMENISLVSWSDICIQDDVLAREWSAVIDSVNVHEMAHSYFGDSVVCRDFAHAWLKESWATYMEQCWFEHSMGEDEAAYLLLRHADAYFEEADSHYRRPIVTRAFRSSRDMYDRHLYPGGACRLHMLRRELGDEAFWSGVRRYLARFNGQVVETDDFRRVMEECSGRSLGQFFDQWFFRPGYPRLKVGFRHDAERGEGTVTIEQDLEEEDGGTVPFVFTTEIGWEASGLEHRQRVTVAHARQIVTVPMPEAPAQVRFDPGNQVLARVEFFPGDARLRRQLTSATDVIGRIAAARALVDSAQPANIDAIVNAYHQEKFWGVRRELAALLGKCGTAGAMQGLLGILTREQDPRVLEAAFRSAARYRETAVREAVEARVDAGLPYRAAGAAYEALGAQREQAPWERLLHASGTADFSGFAQSGALLGLAATRRREAVDVLLERVAYGATPHRARPAAVRALADIGRVQERGLRERIGERLGDLLRDPVYAVRRAAAHGLAAMREAVAVDALQAYKNTLTFEDRVKVERLIEGLRAAERPAELAAGKRLEELQDRYRKLEERLAALEGRMRQ